MNLNKFYGETTGMYWLWKNYFEKTNADEWIGFCQYRRLWLNDLYNKKHQLHSKSLYANLLKSHEDMKILVMLFYFNLQFSLIKILLNNLMLYTEKDYY